jgi:hypothetical protein
MTEDGKVKAEPAPHGSYDDNTRRTGAESRPQGDIPAVPTQFQYRTGVGSARSLQFIREFQSTKSASLKDNFTGLFVATLFSLGPSSLGSG